MKRRAIGFLVIALMVLGSSASFADDNTRYPVPESGVITGGTPGTCVPQSEFDMPDYYGAACSRLKVVFGPIIIKPGQNDILIQPVTFEKPMYDGMLTRFQPSLIEASAQNRAISPPVEDVHLHHGTWLNSGYVGGAGRTYGSGPWIASGEEKTIVAWPKGYGLNVKPDDAWLFLHMVHNATAVARAVWVTYDIDFVAKATADTLGIKNTRGIWLDVGNCGWGQGETNCDSYPYNPIYNSQKGFGHTDDRAFLRVPDENAYTVADGTAKTVCGFPAENCADFNSEGLVSGQQGKPALDRNGAPIVVYGRDTNVTTSMLGGQTTGTLVVMGGHLHTGGIRDEVSLVRGGVERPIHISDAYYWNAKDPNKIGARPVSWDFSMTGSTNDLGWAINVQAGDKIRLNSIYDAEIGSWYENMGIVMTWVLPGEQIGYDVFAKNGDGSWKVALNPGVPRNAAMPAFATDLDADSLVPYHERCDMTLNGDGTGTLCLRGPITHPHYKASGNHGNCSLVDTCPALSVPSGVEGPLMDTIPMGGFNYGPADFAVIGVQGIPRVMQGTPVKFVNLDTADNMWHTVTRCAYPCTGPTTVDYPIADGGAGIHDPMDFDSSELGIGLSVPNRVDWTFTPAQKGVYTFFCRVHPSMRGAIEVV